MADNNYKLTATMTDGSTLEMGTFTAPQGERGEKGDTGPQGPRGLQGERGPQGLQGPVGPQGATGPTGPSGQQGPKGDTGNRGAQTWHVTTAVSSVSGYSSTAIVGDAFVNAGSTTINILGVSAAVGDVIRSTSNTAGVKTGNLRGPQGQKGETGAPGADGADGATGAQGPVGAQGPQGPQGPAGPQPPLLQAPGISTTDGISQKGITDNFAQKTGTYPDMEVGKASQAIAADSASRAIAADRALYDNNGNIIHNYYLPKNGPDLVVGQTLSALVSGKSYLDCAITATVSSGTYYFYNCTGAITINGSTVKLYLTNCPNLTVEEKYFGAVIRDGKTLLYDKNSSYSSLNWGLPSGIEKTNGKISKNFSAYKHLIIEAMLSDYAMGLSVVGSSGTITSMSGSGNYFGIMEVFTLADSIQVATAREWNIFVGSSSTVNCIDNDSNYYINKIYGVLK